MSSGATRGALRSPTPVASSAALPVGRFHVADANATIESDGQQVVLETRGVRLPLTREPGADNTFSTEILVGKRGTPRRRMTHVEAEFNPAGGLRVSGDYFSAGGTASFALGEDQRHPLVGLPSVGSGRGSREFVEWGRRQVDTVPETQAVFADVQRLLESEHAPETVTDLIEFALDSAWRQAGNDPLLDRGERARSPQWPRTVLTAFVALGTHAQPMDGNGKDLLPEFLPDGRVTSNDKTRHLLSQGMFTAVSLYDRRFGDGAVAQAFESVVDEMDHEGRAAVIDQAYDHVKGELGPLLGPRLETPLPGPYVPRPDALSEDESRAYDSAVRLGAVYEHVTTLKQRPGYQVRELEDEREKTAVLPDAYLDTFRGLTDAGVTFDLSANRIGAETAVKLMRGESAFIPFEGSSEFALLPPKR